MFDKFEVLESWKLSWDLSFLLLGVTDGHIFFDFSNHCPEVSPIWPVGKYIYEERVKYLISQIILCICSSKYESKELQKQNIRRRWME